MPNLTRLLDAAQRGDRRATAELLPLVYDELRTLAASRLLALDEALDRLAAIEPRAAEVVKLRYFAGLTVPEVADALGIAPRTADADWAYARAWLVAALRDGD